MSTPVIVCPYCGERRLIEADDKGRCFCNVCGHGWIDSKPLPAPPVAKGGL